MVRVGRIISVRNVKGAYSMSKINKGYSLNECPPMKETIIYSIQQIIVAVFNVIPVPLLIGAGIGLSQSEITILVAGCLLVTGIATILQTIGVGPIGSRLPIVLECSFVFVAPGIALGSKYGLNVYTGACLVGSIITLISWTLFHRTLTKMFKPYITGSVVMVLGISLCNTGISYCAGGSGAADFGDPINLLLATGTIVIMLILNRYGKGFLSKASALIAIVIMSAISALFGKLDLLSIANEKWFRIPEPLHFGIKFNLGPIVTISILCFIALVELMGDQASAAMLSDQRLPSVKESKGGIMAQGISSIISSMFNMVPTISGSANIGLCGITGVTSRYVVCLAGVVIAICSICPKLCAIFSIIPYPILGGVALTAFGTILVSGMNVIRNSELTNRETTIVGVSLAVGIGFSMVPDSLAAFPFWASSLLSGVPGTALTAIVLSLLLKENKTDNTQKGDEK